MNWKQEYKDAYNANLKERYPIATQDFGLLICKFPNVNTSNGLTLAIINFLNWKGHYATRINTTGRLLQKKYSSPAGWVATEQKWIPGTTAPGTADVSAIVGSIPLHLEIKIGKDTQSPDQKKQQMKVERAGGKYFIVKTIEQFFEIYNNMHG